MNDYQLRSKALYMSALGLNLVQIEGKDPYKEWNINGKLKEYVNECLSNFHKYISGQIDHEQWEVNNEKFLMAADTRIETPVLNYNFKSVRLPISTFNQIDYAKEQLSKKGGK